MARVKIERKTDWSLRPAAVGDKGAIAAFFERTTWKEKAAEGLYEWKFEKNPQGETLIMEGVNNEEAIIAIGVFMPWRLAMGEKIIYASQWVDMIVDLAYRGQGIPSRVLEAGRDNLRLRGGAICFAFPNQNGVLVHKENNGLHLGNILRYVKPLRSEYLVKRYIRYNPLAKAAGLLVDFILKLVSKETYCAYFGKFTFLKVERCGPEFDDFWRRFSESNSGRVMTKRDSSYLNWKYVESPNQKRRLYALYNEKRLCAFAALETAGEIGYIVDLAAYDRRGLDMAIAHSISHFRKEGVSSAAYIALENDMYADCFRSFGFMERPEKKDFYMYLEDGVQERGHLMDSRDWHITIGDCDIERL